MADPYLQDDGEGFQEEYQHERQKERAFNGRVTLILELGGVLNYRMFGHIGLVELFVIGKLAFHLFCVPQDA